MKLSRQQRRRAERAVKARSMKKQQQSDAHPSMLDAALSYAADRGWYVFPAPADGRKMGCTSADKTNGRRWGATRDPAEIRRYFKIHRRANVGIVTGPDSGIFVVEADTLAGGHANDGIASLHALEHQHGKLPDTLMAMSPSGSPHRYFKWPGVFIGNSEIAPGVDVLGEGGMVLAPPSLRPGKGRYRWLNDLPIAEAPSWLIDLCKKDDQAHDNKQRMASNYPPPEPWKSLRRWRAFRTTICLGTTGIVTPCLASPVATAKKASPPSMPSHRSRRSTMPPRRERSGRSFADHRQRFYRRYHLRKGH